jgi:hypothetical protein
LPAGEGVKTSKKQSEAATEEAVAGQKTSRAGRKTQPVNYKESGKGGAAGQSVAVKEEAEVESEEAAIKQLAAGTGPFR